MVSKIFFSNLVGRIFFSLLNALQDIFPPHHFSAGFFFLKKGSRVYIYKILCLFFGKPGQGEFYLF